MKPIFILSIAFAIAFVPAQSFFFMPTPDTTYIQNAVNNVMDYSSNIESLMSQFFDLALAVGEDSIIPIIIGDSTFDDFLNSLSELFQLFKQTAAELTIATFSSGVNALDQDAQHVLSVLKTPASDALFHDELNQFISFTTNVVKQILVSFYSNFDNVIDYFNSKIEELIVDVKHIFAGSVIDLLSGTTTPEAIMIDAHSKFQDHFFEIFQYAISYITEKTTTLFEQLMELGQVNPQDGIDAGRSFIDQFFEDAKKLGEDSLYPIINGQTTVSEVLSKVGGVFKTSLQQGIQSFVSASSVVLSGLGPEFQQVASILPPQSQKDDAKELNVVTSFIVNSLKQALVYSSNVFEVLVDRLKLEHDEIVEELEFTVRKWTTYLNFGMITKRQLVDYAFEAIRTNILKAIKFTVVYVSQILLVLGTQYMPLMAPVLQLFSQFSDIDLSYLLTPLQQLYAMALDAAYTNPMVWIG